MEALLHKNTQQKLLITLSRRYKCTEMELILPLFEHMIYLHWSYMNARITRCSKLEIIKWRHLPTYTSTADIAVLTCGKSLWWKSKPKNLGFANRLQQGNRTAPNHSK